MYSNIFSSEIRQQNRTEQNRTEQNRTEQNRTGFLVKVEQSGLQNNYKIYFVCKTELLQNLFQLQNKILQSLFQSFNRTIISYTKQNIIFNYFKFFYAIF